MANRIHTPTRTHALAVSSLRTLQVVCQLTFLIALMILSLGCTRNVERLYNYALSDEEGWERSPFRTAEIATQIDRYYRGVQPGPVGVTTFVDLNDLYKTSSFGRVYAEQLMGELAVRGYDVVELRHADALQFLGGPEGGEFGLSREVSQVRRSRDLGAVIVGTYLASPNRVYINARLVDPSNSAILSAGSVEIDRSKEVAKLLRIGGMPASLERIPVKHLTFGSVPAMQGWAGWRMDPLEMGMAGGTPPPPASAAPAPLQPKIGPGMR